MAAGAHCRGRLAAQAVQKWLGDTCWPGARPTRQRMPVLTACWLDRPARGQCAECAAAPHATARRAGRPPPGHWSGRWAARKRAPDAATARSTSDGRGPSGAPSSARSPAQSWLAADTQRGDSGRRWWGPGRGGTRSRGAGVRTSCRPRQGRRQRKAAECRSSAASGAHGVGDAACAMVYAGPRHRARELRATPSCRRR